MENINYKRWVYVVPPYSPSITHTHTHNAPDCIQNTFGKGVLENRRKIPGRNKVVKSFIIFVCMFKKKKIFFLKCVFLWWGLVYSINPVLDCSPCENVVAYLDNGSHVIIIINTAAAADAADAVVVPSSWASADVIVVLRMTYTTVRSSCECPFCRRCCTLKTGWRRMDRVAVFIRTERAVLLVNTFSLPVW